MSASRPIHVLLIEDNAGDVVLAQHVLSGYPEPVVLHVAANEEQAVFARRIRARSDHSGFEHSAFSRCEMADIQENTQSNLQFLGGSAGDGPRTRAGRLRLHPETDRSERVCAGHVWYSRPMGAAKGLPGGALMSETLAPSWQWRDPAGQPIFLTIHVIRARPTKRKY